jgi:hypothetical protein
VSHRTTSHLDHSVLEAAGHDIIMDNMEIIWKIKMMMMMITIFSLPIRLPTWKNLSLVSQSITEEDQLFHNHDIACTIT